MTDDVGFYKSCCRDLPHIMILDDGKYIHYPASPDDVWAVLQRLPGEAGHGIPIIDYRLNSDAPPSGHDDMVMDFPPTRHDPHTDRNGIELLPGVYAAFIGGCLHPFSHRIVLTAYVYDSALPDREMWECYLRMHMLSVLMHEVGHHVDGVTAQKPLPCEYDRREQAAECYAAIWTRAVVIPYLREQYADAVQALEAWVTEWAGQSITLDQLIDDPPALPGEPGWTAPRWLLPPRTLLSHLAYAVAQGKSRHAIHDWYRDYLAFQCMTCGDT